MKSNIYDRIEVQLIASCIYNKIDKSAKLYLLSRLSTTDSNNLRSVRLCSITSSV